MEPSKSTTRSTTSGVVVGGGVLGRGMSSFTAWVWMGSVRISRVRSTSITSMSGVVLMSTSTSPSACEVDIAMGSYLFSITYLRNDDAAYVGTSFGGGWVRKPTFRIPTCWQTAITLPTASNRTFT